ncbi:MAG: type II toxin-antitoxin system Phd/YefM family antitoxin [Blastocatellales bacterium]|nr:type II toxin-antitoxin system Phd/YefM family antitoxin [Blastocatellales bacterium]
MSTQQIDIKEARVRFPDLLDAAVKGEEIVITQDDRPIIRLTPISGAHPRRQAGSAAGQVTMSPDFNDSYEEDGDDLP